MSKTINYSLPNAELLRTTREAPNHKSPAFQFYPNDWLGSNEMAIMDLAETGMYINLLAASWGTKDCGLINDDLALAKFAKADLQHWIEHKENILKNFFTNSGRIYNRRLLLEKVKQITISRIRTKAGNTKKHIRL